MLVEIATYPKTSLQSVANEDVSQLVADTSVSMATTMSLTPISNQPMSPLSSVGRSGGQLTSNLSSSLRKIPGPLKTEISDPYEGVHLLPLNERPFQSLAAIARH